VVGEGQEVRPGMRRNWVFSGEGAAEDGGQEVRLGMRRKWVFSGEGAAEDG